MMAQHYPTWSRRITDLAGNANGVTAKLDSEKEDAGGWPHDGGKLACRSIE
jgi:hypothetical protein